MNAPAASLWAVRLFTSTKRFTTTRPRQASKVVKTTKRLPQSQVGLFETQSTIMHRAPAQRENVSASASLRSNPENLAPIENHSIPRSGCWEESQARAGAAGYTPHPTNHGKIQDFRYPCPRSSG